MPDRTWPLRTIEALFFIQVHEDRKRCHRELLDLVVGRNMSTLLQRLEYRLKALLRTSSFVLLNVRLHAGPGRVVNQGQRVLR